MLGKIDCINGEDERKCFQLETNECDLKSEYRCSNGQCIPEAFFFDSSVDCLDGSDEHPFRNTSCPKDPFYFCEDFVNSIGEFSCGDGQFLSSNEPLYLKSVFDNCLNGRNILYSLELYSYKNLNKNMSECYKYVQCALKSLLFSSIINCVDICMGWNRYCGPAIKNLCPSFIVYPLQPILDSHVYFVYTPEHFLNVTDISYENYLPDYICYNFSYCSTFIPTVYINNRTCRLSNEFNFRQKIYKNWLHLFNDLRHVFKACLVATATVSLLPVYHCPNSSKSISKHRLFDSIIDCPGSEDEQEKSIVDDSCSLRHRFKCRSEDKCIPRRFLMDSFKQCQDSSDESFGEKCQISGSYICEYIRGTLPIEKLITFPKICNKQLDLIKPDEYNETDETDCKDLPCITRYTLCDGLWTCLDGNDEVECPNTFSDQCRMNNISQSHYCVNPTNGEMGCLPIQYAADTYVHCLGATDERYHCQQEYPLDYDKRYKCWKSTICISPLQLCDCNPDCPLQDDESDLLCPWGTYQCESDWYPCLSGKWINRKKRCDGLFEEDCPHGDDEYFCDLIDKPLEKYFSIRYFIAYDGNNNISLIEKQHQKKHQIQQQSFSSLPFVSPTKLAWFCHRGIYVHSSNLKKNFSCFCPPSYYGDRCQYQTKRLSVLLQLQTPATFYRNLVYRLIISLIDPLNGTIISYEDILYTPDYQCVPKIYFNLLYSQLLSDDEQSKFYVRIDVYRLHLQGHWDYRGSWYFEIKFSFLPVNRLSTILILTGTNQDRNWIRENCDCGQHGECIQYINANKFFCQCHQGWSGNKCNIDDSCHCSPGSLCIGRGRKDIEPICLCQLGRIGSRCYVPYLSCEMFPCQNHGTCISLDDKMWQRRCVCSEEYFGDACEYNSSHINIIINKSIFKPPSSILVHMITLHENEQHKHTSYLKHIHLYQQNLIIYHPTHFLPQIGFIEIFDVHKDKSNYYLSLLLLDKPMKKELVYVKQHERCQHIRELFNDTIIKYHKLKRTKSYYYLCVNKIIQPFECFYDDDDQMCFCNYLHQLDCFYFKHNHTECHSGINYCENNGKCLQNDERCSKTSICICPKCYYGTLCQFTISRYSLSLDAIIGPHILQNTSIKHQSFVVKISLVVVILMFVFGLIDSSLSILTFLQPKTREYGCGFYLLFSSITSLITMCSLIMKFLYLLLTQIWMIKNRYGCIMIEFSLKFFLSTNAWLNAYVGIERATNIRFGLQFNKKRSITMAKLITLLIVFLNITSAIHDPFYRRLIEDSVEQRTWCVVSYSSSFLKIYDTTIEMIHFLIPFSINIISALIIIIGTTTIKSTVQHTTNYHQQFYIHKHLITSPIILICLALPRLVISYISTCMEPTRDPYLLLAGYFVSFVPSALTFIIFVLPSQTYKREFYRTMKSIRLFFKPSQQ
ncbi:unnamed protein product [Rotaria sp. Silwood1]|nr:unnamed protein product [Rotaria sp. Silwood1]CAF1614645.1 unnamed protein product [Rotaria sp. Silwood1]